MDTYALQHNNIRFDTDSYPIKVDNCCTQTISGYKEDFIPHTLRPIHNKQVRGFGDTITKITHQGTIVWQMLDDLEGKHDIVVPNSYYVPNCGIRLLSPQHWAQERKDNLTKLDGTICITYHDRIVLKWQQQNYTKTLHIDPNKYNVAKIWTSGGYTSITSPKGSPK
jgi:hypothetical protein